MRILFTLLLVAGTTLTYASSDESVLISQLHEASQDIEEHSNGKLITESLYKQIRPRAKITNHKLSEAQIDEKVRKYIVEKYAPALVSNYSQIYADLHTQKKNFSSCSSIEAIKDKEDILKALCLVNDGSSIKVQYMTNGYDKGWSAVVGFVFATIADKLQLIAIELQLKEGTKAYVEGI